MVTNARNENKSLNTTLNACFDFVTINKKLMTADHSFSWLSLA